MVTPSEQLTAEIGRIFDESYEYGDRTAKEHLLTLVERERKQAVESALDRYIQITSFGSVPLGTKDEDWPLWTDKRQVVMDEMFPENP